MSTTFEDVITELQHRVERLRAAANGRTLTAVQRARLTRAVEAVPDFADRLRGEFLLIQQTITRAEQALVDESAAPRRLGTDDRA